MENLNNEAIFNLMQNVVDKLDEVSAKVDIKNENVEEAESDFLINLPIEFKKLVLQQNTILKQIDTSKLELTNALKSTKGTNESHNYKYIMFGKDSPLNTRFIIYMIAFVVISWSSIKYLPSYFLEQSELQQEKKNYELFYNYLYLKQIDSKNNTSQQLEAILNKIKKGDHNIYKEYKSLLTRYQKKLRKQELENELKQLQ